MRFTAHDDPRQQGLGGSYPEPGRYHVTVLEVDDSYSAGRGTTVPVEMAVCAGDVDGQQDKRTKHFFYLPPNQPEQWAQDRFARFLWACGLLKPGETKNVDLKDAEGCHLLVRLEEERYTNRDGQEKTSLKIADGGAACWPIGDSDPEAQKIPVDRSILPRGAPPWKAGGDSAAQEKAAESQALDDFADL